MYSNASLHKKIIYPIVIVMMLLVFILSGYNIYSSYTSEMKNIKSTMTIIFDLTSKSLINPLYQFNVTAMSKIIADTKTASFIEEAVVLDQNKNILTDGTKENVNAYTEFPSFIPEIKNNIIYMNAKKFKLNIVQPIYAEDQHLGYITAKVSLHEVYERIFTLITFSGILLLFTLLIAAVIGLILKKSIDPIKELAITTENLSKGKGDLTITIPVISKDEIGVLANNFNLFLDSMNSIIVSLKEKGDSLFKTAETLNSSIEENTAGFEEINSTVHQVSENVVKQKVIVQNAIENITETLLGLENITKQNIVMREDIFNFSITVDDIIKSIQNATELSNSGDKISILLAQSSERGYDDIASLDSALKELAKNSEDIKDMVNFIISISSQTNLLAMNAAIEAAHAGESGKGFTVVADEIRKLAEDSSRGANEIKSSVKSITVAIEEGLKRGAHALESFTEVKTNISMLQDVNNQIATSMTLQNQSAKKLLSQTTNLHKLSDTVSQQSEIETERSSTVRKLVDDLENISDEIHNSIIEETTAVDEMMSSFVLMQEASSTLHDIASSVETTTNMFKTR